MTSGEWDLRALKALEEEEIKQFGAIAKPENFSSNIFLSSSSASSSPLSSCISVPPPSQLAISSKIEEELFDDINLISTPLSKCLSSSVATAEEVILPKQQQLGSHRSHNRNHHQQQQQQQQHRPFSSFLNKFYYSTDNSTSLKNQKEILSEQQSNVILEEENYKTEKLACGYKTYHQQHQHKNQQQQQQQQHHHPLFSCHKKARNSIFDTNSNCNKKNNSNTVVAASTLKSVISNSKSNQIGIGKKSNTIIGGGNSSTAGSYLELGLPSIDESNEIMTMMMLFTTTSCTIPTGIGSKCTSSTNRNNNSNNDDMVSPSVSSLSSSLMYTTGLNTKISSSPPPPLPSTAILTAKLRTTSTDTGNNATTSIEEAAAAARASANNNVHNIKNIEHIGLNFKKNCCNSRDNDDEDYEDDDGCGGDKNDNNKHFRNNNEKNVDDENDENDEHDKNNDDDVDDEDDDDDDEDDDKNDVTRLPKAINIKDFELEDHIKNCSCSCNHMGYGNSMDYQTTGFGCLPDVTEHSNIRRTITSSSRQDSTTSNSEFADITSLDKKQKKLNNNQNNKNDKKNNKRQKYCIFSLSITFTLILFGITAVLVYYQFFILKPNRNSFDQRIKIVHKILKEIPLVDGHNNLPWNVRKYAHNSLELIDLSHDFDQKTIWHKPLWSQTDIPRMKEGLLGAQIWSAYVPCEAQGLDAVQLALEQIDIIHRFTELYPNDLTLAVSSQEILSAHKKGALASLIGIEGGHALGSSLGVLRSLHALGARYLTLTHQCDTSWAGSSYVSMDKGLTSFGKAVIKEMNRLGMMIDLSHSSDATARDVLELTRAPVIFSHSVARSLCNSTRNIPDDILRAVADNGGLIMIGFDSQYISCDDTSTLDDVISHIKYIRSIVGIQHIGIGAGFDGIMNPPKGLEDVSKYPNLFAALLRDTNWSEEDIAMLAGKNFLRVLRSVENVRDYWKRAAIQPVELTEPINKKSHCTYMSS